MEFGVADTNNDVIKISRISITKINHELARARTPHKYNHQMIYYIKKQLLKLYRDMMHTRGDFTEIENLIKLVHLNNENYKFENIIINLLENVIHIIQSNA